MNKLITIAFLLLIGCEDSQLYNNEHEGLVKTVTITGTGTNISENSAWGFYYDSENRIETITASGNGVSYGLGFTYSDLAASVRVKKSSDEESYSYTSTITLNDNNEIVSILDGSNSKTTSYNYSSGVLSSATNEASESYLIAWASNNLVSTQFESEEAEIYTYSTSYKNNSNVNINVFISETEQFNTLFSNKYIALNKYFSGISSTYMLSTDSEKTGDVYYTYNDDGTMHSARWVNVNTYVTYEVELSYYQ